MAVQGHKYTHLAAATAAVTNQFVASANMKVGTYTLANSGAQPTAGARKVTVTHTQVGGVTDTLGTITVTGTNLAGAVISEVITPLDGTVATGLLYFATVTSVVGAGWVINTGNDTIVVGCVATQIVAEGAGFFASITVNTTAASTITIKDSAGTIAILKASVAEGRYGYDVNFAGYLEVDLGGASDVTVAAST